jgi:hypothetical protein
MPRAAPVTIATLMEETLREERLWIIFVF